MPLPPATQALLARGELSHGRIEEWGLGNVGITYDVYLWLTQGEPSGWLLKRLRPRPGHPPRGTFSRYQAEHELLWRYFGGELSGVGPSAAMIPETYFLEVEHPAPGSGLRAGDLVSLQRFVVGESLAEVARGGPPEPWLQELLYAFCERYRRLQARELTIPDLMRLASDHVKVDLTGRRLYLLDTNNVISVRRALAQNSLWSRRGAEVALEELHDEFDALAARFGLELPSFDAPGHRDKLTALRELYDLVRWFPRPPAENPYLRALREAFSLPSAAA